MKELDRIVRGKDIDGLMEYVSHAGVDALLSVGPFTFPFFPLISLCGSAGFTEGILRLKREGADVDAGGTGGFTALHQAPSVAVVEALLAAGADIEINDDTGKTPLIHHSESGRAAVVSALISNGANVNAAGELGETALIRASIYGRKDIVELLVAAGADPSLTFKEKTAAEWAEAKGNPEVAAVIHAGVEAAVAAVAAAKEAAEEEAAAKEAAEEGVVKEEAVEEEAAAKEAAEAGEEASEGKPGE
eukprot:PLAT15066.1.p1 GENE.PLAT15066.1~~PLAT15066.1.p1  ORF type:complete len:268 (+),score=91.61 PLAT15066.1:66-806(+)